MEVFCYYGHIGRGLLRHFGLVRMILYGGLTVDASLLEGLFLPWWKIVAYVIVLAVLIMSIRVKFDVNKWLSFRSDQKLAKQRRKAAVRCVHAWTLYPDSQYSLCNRCAALIATATLNRVQDVVGVNIEGVRCRMEVRARRGHIVVTNPIGKGRSRQRF